MADHHPHHHHHSTQARVPARSMLRLSAVVRLSGALALVAALWGAVYWAVAS